MRNTLNFMAVTKKDAVTLGASVPEKLRDGLRKDARRFGKTIDGVTAIALQFWFDTVKEVERGQHYRKLPKKQFGRPLS